MSAFVKLVNAKVTSVNNGKDHLRLGVQWWTKSKGEFVASSGTLMVFGETLPTVSKGDKLQVEEANFRMEESNKWKMGDPTDASTQKPAVFPTFMANADKVTVEGVAPKVPF